MPAGTQSRSAVFLVRVWLEDASLRARITEVADLVGGREETVAVVCSAAEVERRVHDWLETFIAGNARVTPP